MIILRLFVLFFWFSGGMFAMAVLALFPRNRYELMPFYARRVCPTALRILGIDYEIRNVERLSAHQPCIYAFNHQHIWDIFLLGCVMRYRTIVIGKKGLRKIPIFGWVFPRAGNLYIDRGDPEKALATMREAHRLIVELGLSVIVSPEGTRSGKRGLLPFKKGPFHLAMGTKLPMLPIAISTIHKSPRRIVAEALEPMFPVTLESSGELHARMKAAIERLDAELAGAQKP